MGKFWAASGAAAAFLVLILDSKTALLGAQQGLMLCICSVIPALFPFLVLSAILTGSLYGTGNPVLDALARLFRMPGDSGSLLVPAFLGGYPAGAKAIGDLYHQGLLDRHRAQRLLTCCCNAGPSFLFGITAPFFPSKSDVWTIWGIQILCALTAARLLPEDTGTAAIPEAVQVPTAASAMKGSIAAMGSICGWILVFRILIAFGERWFLWLLPQWTKAAVVGFLELANGCMLLGSIPEYGVRFLLCNAMLSFGGLCVAMQTASVLHGLPIRNYLLSKLAQSVLSLGYAAIYLQYGVVPLVGLGIALCCSSRVRSEKRGSILRRIRV